MASTKITSSDWASLPQKTGSLVVRGGTVEVVSSVDKPSQDTLGVFVSELHKPITFDLLNTNESLWLKSHVEGLTAEAEVYPILFRRLKNGPSTEDGVSEDDVRRIVSVQVPPMVNPKADQSYVAQIFEDLYSVKADKATTYTKDEVDSRINHMHQSVRLFSGSFKGPGAIRLTDNLFNYRVLIICARFDGTNYKAEHKMLMTELITTNNISTTEGGESEYYFENSGKTGVSSDYCLYFRSNGTEVYVSNIKRCEIYSIVGQN